MGNEIPSIPLANLNCKHCSLYKTDQCKSNFTNPATGKPEPAEKHYCFHIGKNYLGDKEEDVSWLEGLEK